MEQVDILISKTQELQPLNIMYIKLHKLSQIRNLIKSQKFEPH